MLRTRLLQALENLDASGDLAEMGRRFLTHPDDRVAFAAWSKAIELLGIKRAEPIVGSAAESMREAIGKMHERRTAREEKLAALAPKLKAMTLEELWKYEPENDPDDDDIGIGRLVALKRQLLAEIGELRGENTAAAVRASETADKQSDRPPGSRPALPPAPSPLESGLTSPEPAGTPGWPKPEEMGRLITFEPERK